MGSPGPNGNRWRLRGERAGVNNAFNSAVTFAAADAWSLRRAMWAERALGQAVIEERRAQLGRSMAVVARFAPCTAVSYETGEATRIADMDDALAFVAAASR